MMARLPWENVLVWWKWMPIDRITKRVAGTRVGKQEANAEKFHISRSTCFFNFQWGTFIVKAVRWSRGLVTRKHRTNASWGEPDETKFWMNG
jgi:hypothetical protein